MVEIAHILLVLPNGKIVLQRRDDKAPTAPNMLALFGGHLESGESSIKAMRRELSEETSLNIGDLDIKLVSEFELISQDGTVSHFHTYKADISSADFVIYEGSGAEVYSVSEALARDDIVPSAKHALMKLGG